jgi:long-chain acyl-CoA synthetase
MRYHQKEPLKHLGNLPTMGAERYGDKTAMYYRDQEMSYNDIENQSNQIANGLDSIGIEPDDRVAITMENNLEYAPVVFGINKVGAVAVPVNFQMSFNRLLHVLNDADVDVMFGSAAMEDLCVQLHEQAELDSTFVPGGSDAVGIRDYDKLLNDQPTEFETVDRDFDSDICAQGYTSGTTGNPKGVPMTHENILRTLQSFTETEEIDPETDTTLTITPMYHILGLIGTTLLTLYTGRSLVMVNQTEPSALLEAVDRYEATTFTAVPALYIGMVREYERNPEKYDISSIESLGVGAAPLPKETRDKIENTFGVALVEGWAMTETAAAGTSASARGVQKGAGCIGQPIPGIEMKLVDPDTRETRVPPEHLDPAAPANLTGYEPDFEDETTYTGEIAIRGPQVFDGYHELPEETNEVFDDDGWFYTGDIARVDEDRFLWMVDRADDMMIVGGENVYPAEIEDELYHHPDVQEVAIVGVPHEVKGTAPVAYVVPEDGANVTETQIREYALEHIAAYAHPRKVLFVDEMPRSGTNKVQRFKLEERAEERIGMLESSEEL